jgi:hypothetical protein
MLRAHGVGDRRADEDDRVYPSSPDEMVRHTSRRTRILEESLVAAAARYEAVNMREVAQIGDVHRRFRMLVELLANRHGAAIGSPDWHGTRSASTQSVHWFYDWAPRGSGAARSAW